MTSAAVSMRIFLLGLLMLANSLPTYASEPLTLGIFPYLDPVTLAHQHRPLAEYLQTETGQAVRLTTAPSFKTFRQRTADQHYDLIVTAPHFGREAELRHGYRWIGVTANKMHALFATLRGSGIQGPADLRGKIVALPPKSALIHQMTLKQLERAGLTPGQDVTIRIKPSHNDVMMALYHGDAHAAAFMESALQTYRGRDRDQLQTIGSWDDIPGLAILSNRRLPDQTHEILSTALLRFEHSLNGQLYYTASGLIGIRKTTAEDLQTLDYYLGRIAQARAQK